MALVRMIKWDNMGPIKGGPEYNLLFHGWHGWLSRSEPVRERWKDNFSVSSRIWEEFPYLDQHTVTFEVWSDVVNLSDTHSRAPTTLNS